MSTYTNTPYADKTALEQITDDDLALKLTTDFTRLRWQVDSVVIQTAQLMEIIRANVTVLEQMKVNWVPWLDWLEWDKKINAEKQFVNSKRNEITWFLASITEYVI